MEPPFENEFYPNLKLETKLLLSEIVFFIFNLIF
jgi:hypothetical protein